MMSDTLEIRESASVSQSDHDRLAPCDPLFGPTVASWVRSAEELFLLAPSTRAPLTAAKVARWTARRGRPYLMFEGDDDQPIAYGELNPMVGETGHLWLGHLLVDPDRRRRGVGRRLTRLLVNRAFSIPGTVGLTLVVFPENVAAIRCYERSGFRLAGEQRQRFDGMRRRMLRYQYDAPCVAI